MGLDPSAMSEQNGLLLLYLGLSAALKYGCLALGRPRRRRRESNDLKLVGRVADMQFYPIKGCYGFNIAEASCTKAGFEVDTLIDRQFLVAGDDGEYRSQRLVPRLVLVSPRIHDDQLHLDAPGMRTLVVPLHPAIGHPQVEVKVHERVVRSVYCGLAASEWLSSFLGQSLHLYYHDPSQAPDLAESGTSRWHKTGRPGDKAGFHYFGPYLLTCTASLADLNSRLEEPVGMRPFRSNIIVDTTKAFDEDDWAELLIGKEALFRVLKPCDRCIQTTVHQETGEKHKRQQPLRTLRQYRVYRTASTAPVFGIHPVLDREGIIRVGDPVYAKKQPAWWRADGSKSPYDDNVFMP